MSFPALFMPAMIFQIFQNYPLTKNYSDVTLVTVTIVTSVYEKIINEYKYGGEINFNDEDDEEIIIKYLRSLIYRCLLAIVIFLSLAK